MKTIYIVPIEPIDQRYSKQWYDYIPKLLSTEITNSGLNFNVITISGAIDSDSTTSGAFLDFSQTNKYKASQICEISKLFTNGSIIPGDKFLVTDAWNFTITSIKYMSELLNIPVEIHSIWHAGAYDPSDILGSKMSQPWPSYTELGFFHSCDYNYFASEFHRSMFLTNLNIDQQFHYKAVYSGQPYSYLYDEGACYDKPIKNGIIYPHRINPDKQPEIFEHLIDQLPFNSLMTKKYVLSKDDYYDKLGRAKFIFSCSLNENLGIGMVEGVLAGAIPIVPDRCSYSEMYLDEFKYPSNWTSSYENYIFHSDNLVKFISDLSMKNIDQLLIKQKHKLNQFLNPSVMIDCLLK